MFTNRAAQGIAECERALALDRNLADAHAFIGLAKYLLGRGAETEAHINEALRLSPRDIVAYRWMTVCRLRQIAARRRRRSGCLVAPEHRGQPKLSFRAFFSRRCSGAARPAGRGAGRRAGGTCAQPKLHHPPLPRVNASSDNPTYLAGRERIYEGMRLAGVPEG